MMVRVGADRSARRLGRRLPPGARHPVVADHDARADLDLAGRLEAEELAEEGCGEGNASVHFVAGFEVCLRPDGDRGPSGAGPIHDALPASAHQPVLILIPAYL